MKKLWFLLLIVWFLGFSGYGFAKTWYYNDYAQYSKVIRVNTFANVLSYYEYGKKIGEMQASVGDKRNYTPEGRFRITNKHEFMYSKSAGKFMPFWMEFWRGKYGIHALAEDSAGNLNTSSVIGNTAAWWCVRLEKSNAETLYKRSEIGTKVLIAYDKHEFANPIVDKETIKKYYTLISKADYNNAFLMKTSPTSSLKDFIKTYTWTTIVVDDIVQIDGGEYKASLSYTKDTKTRKGKATFFVARGKIVRSFITK